MTPTSPCPLISSACHGDRELLLRQHAGGPPRLQHRALAARPPPGLAALGKQWRSPAPEPPCARPGPPGRGQRLPHHRAAHRQAQQAQGGPSVVGGVAGCSVPVLEGGASSGLGPPASHPGARATPGHGEGEAAGPCLICPLPPSQDMELAHRELLRSLAGESGSTTPVGSFHTEAARWTDSSLPLPARETLASDSRDGHQPAPCSEDGERGDVLWVPVGDGRGSSSSLSTVKSSPQLQKGICREPPQELAENLETLFGLEGGLPPKPALTGRARTQLPAGSGRTGVRCCRQPFPGHRRNPVPCSRWMPQGRVVPTPPGGFLSCPPRLPHRLRHTPGRRCSTPSLVPRTVTVPAPLGAGPKGAQGSGSPDLLVGRGRWVQPRPRGRPTCRVVCSRPGAASASPRPPAPLKASPENAECI